MSAIEVCNLSVAIGGRYLVRDVSFEVPVGSVVAVIGPNGSGKTTTIRAILGLIRPTSGSVHVTPPRNRIGVLFDKPWLYPHLTAEENIRVVARSLGIPKPDIGATLSIVGLSGCERAKVRDYSAGMRQRLGIALALLSEPELLVLDEPLTGLDPGGIQNFRDFIRAFSASGGTVVWSSHHLAEVQRISTHVVFLSAGQLLYGGPIEGVLEQSRHALVTMDHPLDAETIRELESALLTGGFQVSGVEQVGAGDLEAAYMALAQRRAR